MKRKWCSVTGCGRKVSSFGLCQTHRKYQRAGRELGPIQSQRPGRRGTVRYSGLSVSAGCAKGLARTAKRRGLAANAVITDILEAWVKRHTRRLPQKGRRQ